MSASQTGAKIDNEITCPECEECSMFTLHRADSGLTAQCLSCLSCQHVLSLAKGCVEDND